MSVVPRRWLNLTTHSLNGICYNTALVTATKITICWTDIDMLTSLISRGNLQWLQKKHLRWWLFNCILIYTSAISTHCGLVAPYGARPMFHKSQNASEKYPTMHHFVAEMCTHVHISVTKYCIVGYGTDAFWDLWDGSNRSGSTLNEVMACHLFSAKPLHEPSPTYCHLNTETNFSEIWIKT